MVDDGQTELKTAIFNSVIASETLFAKEAKNRLDCRGKLLGCFMRGIAVRAQWQFSNVCGNRAYRALIGNFRFGDEPEAVWEIQLNLSRKFYSAYCHHYFFKGMRFFMKTNKGRYSWAIKITIATFFISLVIGITTNTVLDYVNLGVAFVVLVAVIFLGIIFDIIGISVTSATEVPFHSKSTRGHTGSKEAIALIRNAEKVSSFCNDVIGDIAGVISGGLAAAIVTLIHAKYSFFNAVILNFLLTAIVAALTVGGKAMGKGFAIRNSEQIITRVGKVVFYGKRLFHIKHEKRTLK